MLDTNSDEEIFIGSSTGKLRRRPTANRSQQRFITLKGGSANPHSLPPHPSQHAFNPMLPAPHPLNGVNGGLFYPNAHTLAADIHRRLIEAALQQQQQQPINFLQQYLPPVSAPAQFPLPSLCQPTIPLEKIASIGSVAKSGEVETSEMKVGLPLSMSPLLPAGDMALIHSLYQYHMAQQQSATLSQTSK